MPDDESPAQLPGEPATPTGAEPAAPTPSTAPAPVYSYATCAIHIRLMLMPDDQNPSGRRVWIGVREDEGDLLLDEARLSDLEPLPARIVALLDQLQAEMPQRASAARTRMQAPPPAPPATPPARHGKTRTASTVVAASPPATPTSATPILPTTTAKKTKTPKEDPHWVQSQLF